MVRVVILLALFGAPAALAQTVYTYCDQVGQQTNCRTRLPRQQLLPALQARPPDVIGSYRALQENRRADELLRLEEERLAQQQRLLEQQSALLDAQTDVLLQQLQSQRASTPPSEAVVAGERANQSLIRHQKYLEQIGACVRLHPDRKDADACVDRLIVSDPDFARTRAERAMQSMRDAAEGKGPFGLPPEKVLDVIKAPPKSEESQP